MQSLQSNKDKNQFSKKKSKSIEKNGKEGPQQKKYPTYSHCKKTTYLEKYYWWRPDAMCGNCKQLGMLPKSANIKIKVLNLNKHKLLMQIRRRRNSL